MRNRRTPRRRCGKVTDPWCVSLAGIFVTLAFSIGTDRWAPGGQPRVAFGVGIVEGRIATIDLVADPEQLGRLDLIIL